MALKMLYRGPSSRLETLIEKIQQNKDSTSDIESSNTSPSYSPSLPDMANTQNFEVENMLNINNNNKIIAKSRSLHSNILPTVNGNRNEDAIDELKSPESIAKESQRSAEEIGVAYTTPTMNTSNRISATEQRSIQHLRTKGEGSRAAKYGKVNGASLSQLPSNTNNNNNNTSNNNNNNNVEGSYHCQFCDKSFPRLGYLKKHEQSHAEHMPFKCEYCARLFKHKRSRDRHTKLHTGDRRYRCPHCEAAFSRSDHLKIHMKTHDNQKPFQCTVCNRGYNTAAALTSHMQNHKKQAALQRNGTLNYSPRSTGSASSNNSLYKRKYSPQIDPQRELSQTALLASNAKRIAYNNTNSCMLYCIYCTKNDFENMEQLHLHVQQMHAIVLQESGAAPFGVHPGIYLSCEFCTMKFTSVSAMFQHIRSMHIDRINSPIAYMEHLNRRSLMTNASEAIDEIYHRKSSDSFVHPLERPKSSDTIGRNIESNSIQSKNMRDPHHCKDHEHEINGKPLRNGDIKQEDLPTDLSNRKSDIKDTVKGASDSFGSAKDDANRQRNLDRSPKTPYDPPKELLRCSQCNTMLTDFEAFRDHVRGHLARGDLKNFVCFHCGVSFIDQSEYELHVVSHFLINATEYACTFGCDKQFDSADAFQKHLFDVHAQSVWKCSICSELFESKVGIQIHFAMAHTNKEKTLRCSACGDTFDNDTEFKGHVRAQHAFTFSPTNLQCSLCRHACASELEMHFHLATHSRQYRCTMCPETFHVEFLLDRHMQSHHCLSDNINNNMFDFTYTLNASHNAKKLYPFAANVGPSKLFDGALHTPASSASTSPLKFAPPLFELYDNIGKSFYGEANKHFMNLYKSDYASKMFLRSNPLVLLPPAFSDAHAAISESNKMFEKSSGEPQFICSICDRSDFSSESEMITHQKMVHNIKAAGNLKCVCCSESFRTRHELDTHMKLAHADGKHKCPTCDETFQTTEILAEHKLIHARITVKGKCTFCAQSLCDVQSFKMHMSEHGNVDLPVQCICCRETLNSNYEIELHAKFHIQMNETERNCALCLIPLTPTSDAKACKKCQSKFLSYASIADGSIANAKESNGQHKSDENFCNLCKASFATSNDLEEHLIKHSFQGCEERGFNCYICSAIFTLPSGLHQHMLEHGSSYRPYDCSQCSKKFFFRAELDNHLIDHENGRIAVATDDKLNRMPLKYIPPKPTECDDVDDDRVDIKSEASKSNAEDDDEYIEVEQIGDNSGVEQMTNDSDDNKQLERPTSYHDDESAELAHP